MMNKHAETVLAVEVTDLCKIYGGQRVIDYLNLTVPDGGIFGLLGPNGAGKTTLMKIMAGLVRPTAGQLKIFGADASARKPNMKCRVGLAPQDNNMERSSRLKRHCRSMGGYLAFLN